MMRKAGALVIACWLVAGCGPDTGALRQYIMNSPHRRMAFMPLSLAPNQRDIRGFCTGTLNSRLTDLGFSIVRRPPRAKNAPVFANAGDVPRVEDVLDYAKQCGTATVLVGRIERAEEGKPGVEAVIKTVRRWRNDPGGKRVAYDEDVIVHPERPPKPALFRIDLKLFDGASGRVLWQAAELESVSDWDLSGVARYYLEQHATALAQAYVGLKL